MKLGTNTIASLKIGSTDISEVRLGSVLVWQNMDADAAAFITAAGITDATQKSAINTLVVDLKAYSLWTKMKAVYPFVGGSATTHAINLKDTASYNMLFSGGWTHSSSGAKPNGINAYADTFFAPGVLLSSSNNSVGFYTGTNLAETSVDPASMGCIQSLTEALILTKGNTDLSSRLNGSLVTYSTGTMKGFYSASKQSAILTDLYVNGSQVSTGNSGGTPPTFSILIGNIRITGGAIYTLGWVVNDFRFAYISDGLTDTDVSNLYTAVQAFQTTLSRNV